MSTDDPGPWPPPDPAGPGRRDSENGLPQPAAHPAPPTQPLPAADVPVPPDTAPPTAPQPPAGARRGNPFGLTALIVGILALVLAVLPYASFAAGLPALVAIVFGIVGMVVRGRPRGTAIAGLIIGIVALITAIVVSAILLTNLVGSAVKNLPQVSDFPSDFPTDILPTEDSGGGAALSPGPHTVTYRVTGTGTASIVYSTLANRHSAFARDLRAALPRTRQQHVTVDRSGGQAAFFVVAVEARAGEPLSCSIAIDGHPVAERTSSGSSGLQTVTCSYRPAP
jgi:hypothetical protein